MQPPVGTLTPWRRAPFTGGGMTYDCYERGTGPGVVLIPEIPGITPAVLGLADHLVDHGFTVVVPSPFGTPGRAPSGAYLVGTVARLCVASEFRAFALGAHRPITDYLRAVAADLAIRTPGKGVGDRPGHPALEARAQVVAFLNERLRSGTGSPFPGASRRS